MSIRKNIYKKKSRSSGVATRGHGTSDRGLGESLDSSLVTNRREETGMRQLSSVSWVAKGLWNPHTLS